MTLSQLRYAVALDSHKHFGQAAKSCHVTQPTLSTQIQKLEQQLGLQLFDRSKKPVLTTKEGEKIIAQARKALREGARVKEIAAEQVGRLSGTLRLGILPTLAPYLLPRLLKPFLAEHPDIHLIIEEMQTDQLINKLRDDQLDAALAAEQEGWLDDSLHRHPLFDEPFVAYIHQDHPLSVKQAIEPDDLAIKDLWLLSSGHCFRDQTLQLCADGEAESERSVQFESGNLETLRTLVAYHGGMTLLPYLATEIISDGDAPVRIVPFSDPTPSRRITLLRSRMHLKSAMIDALIETLSGSLPDELSILVDSE